MFFKQLYSPEEDLSSEDIHQETLTSFLLYSRMGMNSDYLPLSFIVFISQFQNIVKILTKIM